MSSLILCLFVSACLTLFAQIDVSVNAPKSGKIVKLLAAEEDTVSIGQDLFVIEPMEVGECTNNFILKMYDLMLLDLAPAPPPPKEDQPSGATQTKDTSEPADQQVNKAPPEPPKPAESDKKSTSVSETKPSESKKVFKEEKDKSKQKETSAGERPATGTRSETRVCSNMVIRL